MMVNRYSLTCGAQAVANRFSVDATEAYVPQFNAAPTLLLPIITQESQQGLSFFYWGAPPVWANQKPLGERIINTQAEIIPEKSVIKKKLKHHRCLIPADGFYIWKRIGKKSSVPYRFTLADKALFAMAGLWEEYEDEKEESHHTFTLITTAANEWVFPFGERMPAILLPELEKKWLTATDELELLPLLTPFPSRLDHYSVSALVNNPARNDRAVVQPEPPADQFGNLTLFD